MRTRSARLSGSRPLRLGWLRAVACDRLHRFLDLVAAYRGLTPARKMAKTKASLFYKAHRIVAYRLAYAALCVRLASARTLSVTSPHSEGER